MNPLKKGPELKLPDKMPDLKVPKFVADIYADLRNRHLLPLVALLIVAIIAIPILLSESSGSEEEIPVPSSTASTAGASSAKSRADDIVVARSTPGLRSYHDRLRHLTPSNPFESRSPEASKGEGGGEEGAQSSSAEGGEPSGGGSSEGTVTVEGEPAGTTQHLFYFTYEIDVRIVPVSSNGHPSEAEPSVRHGVSELTPLPGRQTPALLFMQPSADEQNALMLVNPNVKGLFGEATCVSGGETCQLLELKPGLPETIVYGGKERTFRIELIKVTVVKTDPPKAQAGNSKNAG
jgi:hypothetical protein